MDKGKYRVKAGFAFIVKDDYMEQIIEAQQRISKRFPFLNDLGKEHNLPHTTLYQGNFADDYDYEKDLQEIAKKLKQMGGALPVSFYDVVYLQRGWYFYLCEKTNEIQALHDFTLDQIQDEIVLDPNRMDRDLSQMSAQQVEGLYRYGYRHARNAFLPHVTIGRRDKNEGENQELLAYAKECFQELPQYTRIGRLTVYEMGENGTHRNTLAQISVY